MGFSLRSCSLSEAVNLSVSILFIVLMRFVAFIKFSFLSGYALNTLYVPLTPIPLKKKCFIFVSLEIIHSFDAINTCTDMSEREKVIAVKYGDHQAFVELYNDYWGQVYDFSRLYISRVADAEEIVQDVFVKLWESRHLLKEDESFKGFLFIITRNIVFSRNRKKVNENLFKTSVLSAFGNESNYNSNSVEEEYCASQLAVFIDKLIGSLPEQQKRCFLLSREENLSYKEIAERLGISPKTVEIHIGKALKFLKNSIERGWEILLSLLSF